MATKTDVVVTTIFEPAWLEGYLHSFRENGHDDDVTLRIIVDKKTPNSVFDAVRAAKADGYRIDCPTLDEQVQYLARLGLDDGFIPWNTDNRRNIGFLRAWENEADVLISIDDDNYCKPGCDFIGEHHVVGSHLADDDNIEYASGGAWYNICERLSSQLDDAFYARGFPYYARSGGQDARLGGAPESCSEMPVAVNAGLWLDDPDVDAASRLVQGPRVREAQERSLVLAPETWSPINTQNTALIREAIPAYYYVRMGFPLGGMKIDRFGDILSGYFLQKCAKQMSHAIRFGGPVADHRRSPHNLFKDLFHELAGMVVVEDFLPWLQELQLRETSYAALYGELAEAISSQADSFEGFIWDDGGRDFLKETAACMRTWLNTIETIGRA
ncbi:MAG TPA: hypothetical protein DIW43_18770 [Spongiibacteraceae bacterium]|nr:hypothetical protein [Spongiibacteraceae bacterium]HCS29506.1 hypothetical protein [Spongiibacteraceae bacterium]|tara:strand:+ start:1173 stop:2330 length:1158 start_codon:yes stop_codon:yes gene_type:complete